eukprot:806437-Prymnesium_polylepis.1
MLPSSVASNQARDAGRLRGLHGCRCSEGASFAHEACICARCTVCVGLANIAHDGAKGGRKLSGGTWRTRSSPRKGHIRASRTEIACRRAAHLLVAAGRARRAVSGATAGLRRARWASDAYSRSRIRLICSGWAQRALPSTGHRLEATFST